MVVEGKTVGVVDEGERVRGREGGREREAEKREGGKGGGGGG